MRFRQLCVNAKVEFVKDYAEVFQLMFPKQAEKTVLYTGLVALVQATAI